MLTVDSATVPGQGVPSSYVPFLHTDSDFRPTCSRCQALRTDCVYEAEEGESRWSALRRHYKTMETERDDLREILTFLQSQPEPEALEILHHIRSSDTQESSSTILQMVRERRGSSHSYSAPSVIAGQTRLPPIRTMIEASEATASPIGPGHFRRTSLASDGSAASYQSSHSGYEPAASQPPSA